MEKEINDKETQLLELLETKNFNALNPSEKQWVVSIINESEYELRRQVILRTQEPESEKVIPLPLILPAKEGKVMVIPVYQAMLAIAATIVIMWFLKFPFEKEELSDASAEVQYVAQIDTVYTDKWKYDTVYQVVEKAAVVEKKVYETRTVVEYVEVPSQIASTAMLKAPQYDLVPDLEAISKEVDGGSSLSADNTLNLIPDVVIKD